MIWLDKKSLTPENYDDVIRQCKLKHSKITLFDDCSEIIDFLKYLFRIKPGLLVRSDRWFRIVLETDYKAINATTLRENQNMENAVNNKYYIFASISFFFIIIF